VKQVPPLRAAPGDVTDWRNRASCVGTDRRLWFPERGDPGRAAPRICAGCPAREPCLEYGLVDPARGHGIWGGLTARERILLVVIL